MEDGAGRAFEEGWSETSSGKSSPSSWASAWRWPTVGKLEPNSTLRPPRWRMNCTSSAPQYSGGYDAVPRYTFGNFIAIAIASVTHGQPVCDSTNVVSGK